MQADIEKLPKCVRRAIELVQGGATLVYQHRIKATGAGEESFHFEPSGRACGPTTARAAIASGLLKPRCDGLFGAESSQSWGA